MKKTRNLHLWIGLICSIFILLQSVTGFLLLNERWFAGDREGREFPGQAIAQMQQPPADGAANGAAPDGAAVNGSAPDNEAPGSSASNGQFRRDFQGRFPGGPGGERDEGGLSFIKNLHKGRIGDTDISLLLNLTAVGMIVLTATGIVLSIRTLRAQSASRRKRQQNAPTAT